MSFTLYPAIDIRDGRVVRLAQGDYARETRYEADPVALATAYAAAGAGWLHLVDLDAARDGGYTLSALLARIHGEAGLRVQTGGGVRGVEDVERLLAGGAARVVVGSVAIATRTRVAGWIERFGADRIVVALDARCAADGTWRPASHGWTQASGDRLEDLVRFYAGVGLRHLLSTDIARDGMASGPSQDLYRLLLQWAPGVQLQASGGVRDAADVAAVRALGCAGVVLGRSLLDGTLDLGEALRC
ncbi:MAG TPA: 1-(5-phosphoribosyl)-5-[(5-phosphoribosylamino)methylideneamino] imidazole-4-carboxamide isomerase [Luteimonas sp.]|nr:1-(5-phosphoribosyl)-5-[(5-phosphoribosylamino)methylideneamino] imidazole-4-carboxamide isomerase [Luteimonas sp.]